MQNVSATFESILRSSYSVRTKLKVNGIEYEESNLYSISTNRRLFDSDSPTIGSAISGEIDIKMDNPTVSIPKMALLEPFTQIFNETDTSEWIPKGKFFIDTRDVDNSDKLTIHGFDAMLKAEQDYPDDGYGATRTALQAVQVIANKIIGSEVGSLPKLDSRTTAILQNTPLTIDTLPVGYSCREVLQNVAIWYSGNFIINDMGQLRLVLLNSIGEETNLLIDEYGDVITFGGDAIIV